MTVIVANDTPPSIRGMLKRWFIEPRPNVFVGSVNSKIRSSLIEYIRRNGPDFGMLMIADARNTQGFTIQSFGDPKRRIAVNTGLQLIAESWAESESGESDNPNDSLV